MASLHYSGKRVLVCGGAGFLGGHLVTALVSAGAEVTVLDPCVSGTGGREANLAAVRRRIQWMQVDSADKSALARAVVGSELVIDAMGFTRHLAGLTNPILDMQLNYLSHLHVARALNETPRPLVYLGSRGQFGRFAGILTEDTPQVPLDPQGIHKSAAKSLFRIYSARYGWPVLSVRLDGCFGPGQMTTGDDIGLVGGFIRSLSAGECVSLYGTTDRSRNIAYGPDVARWILEAAASVGNGFSAVNMFGETVRLTTLLDLVTSTMGRGSYRVTPFPHEIAVIDAPIVEVSRTTLLRHVPDPKPTPLVDALKQTIAYFDAELT